MTGAVLLTCFGARSGGGILRLDVDGRTELLDSISSTGADLTGQGLVRALQFDDSAHGAEIVEYDRRGVRRYLRVDEIREAHDVRALEDGYLVVATGSNEIVRLDRAGGVTERWTAPGVGDA